MVIQYQKDMKKNYMVIEAMESSQEEYCLRMIQKNKIPGLLLFEKRRVDQSVFYYYDISGKQSLEILWSKMKLNYKNIYGVIRDITNTLFCCYDYLLDGDSFVITPNLVFYDLTKQEYNITYVNHHKKDIKKQLCELIEYFMNLVDYEDKEAVYFIYQVHGIAKREEFTLQDLKNLLSKMKEDSVDDTKKPKNSNRDYTETNLVDTEGTSGLETQAYKIHNIHDREDNLDSEGNLDREMNEKEFTKTKIKAANEGRQRADHVVEEEQEVICYPMKTYLFTALMAGMAIGLIVFAFGSGILLNEMKTRTDLGKLAGFFLILICFLAYVMGRIWDKKQRVTRYETIATKVVTDEYTVAQSMKHTYEPLKFDSSLSTETKAYDSSKTISLEAIRGNYSAKKNEMINQMKDSNKEVIEPDYETLLYVEESEEEEEVSNPTVLLSERHHELRPRLVPLDRLQEPMVLSYFPFVVGKHSKHVDYLLDYEVISRYHAKITKEGEQYYLSDLNSTNGTFKNDTALPIYEPQELSHGDIVSFANIRYQFHSI